MKPKCALGKGPWPKYVDAINEHPAYSIILRCGRLSDDSAAYEPVTERLVFSAHNELVSACRELAQQHIVFRCALETGPGREWEPGPADQMAAWQRDGTILESFLRISPTAGSPWKWVIHEITPGGTDDWEIVEATELLGQTQRSEG
jgi:hypothetical protein